MTTADDFDGLDEWDDPLTRVQQPDIARGGLQHTWWDELDRLQNTGDMAAAESLLTQIPDAVERSTEIAGWAVPFAPTPGLIALYVSQEDKESARAVVDRYLSVVEKYVQYEPEDGDRSVQRATAGLTLSPGDLQDHSVVTARPRAAGMPVTCIAWPEVEIRTLPCASLSVPSTE